MTPRALASIYLGQVRRWNDAAIAALNPGVTLPGERIKPFYTAKGGGVSSVVDQWLMLSDRAWRAAGGFAQLQRSASAMVRPNAVVVAQSIKDTPYSIGFVDFDYAIALRLQAAVLRNTAGVFLTPSLNGVRAAVSGAVQAGLRTDFRQSLVAVAGLQAYDPSYFLFLLTHRGLRPHIADPALRQADKAFLAWAVSDHGGQQYVRLTGTDALTVHCQGHCDIPAPSVLAAVVRALVGSITA